LRIAWSVLEGWVVKQALTAWIESAEERDQLTLEALADIEQGLVIDHEAVEAWANSLSTENPLSLPRPRERGCAGRPKHWTISHDYMVFCDLRIPMLLPKPSRRLRKGKGTGQSSSDGGAVNSIFFSGDQAIRRGKIRDLLLNP
jgi:predicted transcriptional regulator